MRISYSKFFIKQVRPLRPAVKARLVERIKLFAQNPLADQLKNHRLKGEYKEYWSINITGDYRALYLLKDDEAIFDQIGTHSQLYG